jgi:secondary thiamine-phosphate synthase enzyme
MKTPAQPLEPVETSMPTPVHLRTPVGIAGYVLHCDTRHKFELVNLTGLVEEQIRESRIREGLAVVQSLHSTAAVFVNEWQPALLEDFRTLLGQTVPSDAPWRHNDPRHSDCDRGNAASHLRALLLGTSVALSVCGGKLLRGPWQSVILAELDGPRTRSVSVQVIGRQAASLRRGRAPRSGRRWLE